MTGDDVKALRKKAGWTQSDLALFLGVTQPTVNRTEANADMPISIGWLAAALYQDLLRELGKFIDSLPRGTEILRPDGEADEPFCLAAKTPTGGARRVRFAVEAKKVR